VFGCSLILSSGCSGHVLDTLVDGSVVVLLLISIGL
jgi:hypothetical protein